MTARTDKYSKITKTVDNIRSKCFNDLVPLLSDALEAVKQQLTSECQRVQAIREEKKQFAAAYNRYVALQRELQERAAVIDQLAGMLGPDGTLQAMDEDSSDAIGETIEVHTAISQLRAELPLWKAIRWYVHYTGEARVNDVLLFLAGLDISSANRNSVESALRLHPEVFSTRKKKGEKHIALERSVNAAATSSTRK